MTRLVGKNLDWVWPNLVSSVVNSGERASPRGIDTIELENVDIEYTHPTYTFTNPIRRLNPVFHLVELMYFMDGRNDDLLVKYISKMADFMNRETERFDGSYGPAIYESMPWVIRALKDTATRRAVVPILRPQHIMNPESKDFPCNIVLAFRIRENELNMNVITRSQDLYRGFLYDTLEFQLLQTLMSSLLGTEIGTYHHTIFSLHLYHDDIDKAQAAAKSMPKQEILEPKIPELDSWNELWKWCHYRCIFMELATHGVLDFPADLPGDDDISNAILAYNQRQNITPLGPYTNWVNKWLE